MLRSVARFTVVFVAMALLVGAHASAQTEAWNQEKVTALAKELESAVSGLRDAVRRSPLMENPQQKARLFRISDKLRLIESECVSLHAHLARGAGMEETLPMFERIQRLRRQTQSMANRTDVSALTQPKLDRANEVLAQLAPFYTSPTPPETKS